MTESGKPKPTWTVEWRGHPSGIPGWVHVFFKGDWAPKDSAAEGYHFAKRLEAATNESLFNNALLASRSTMAFGSRASGRVSARPIRAATSSRSPSSPRGH
jgi:hypothetical protein